MLCVSIMSMLMLLLILLSCKLFYSSHLLCVAVTEGRISASIIVLLKFIPDLCHCDSKPTHSRLSHPPVFMRPFLHFISLEGDLKFV